MNFTCTFHHENFNAKKLFNLLSFHFSNSKIATLSFNKYNIFRSKNAIINFMRMRAWKIKGYLP